VFVERQEGHHPFGRRRERERCVAAAGELELFEKSE
jgi:hypothetical protein